VRKALAGELVEKAADAPDKSENARTFNVYVGEEYFEVAVDEVGGSPVISYVQPGAAPAMPAAAPVASPAPAAPAAPSAPAAPATPAPAAAAPAAAPAPAAASVDGTALKAPMPGLIIKFEKNVGDSIAEGETLVVLEAMKMENALPSPASGTVKAINYSSGDTVAKDDVLCIIG